MGLDTASCSNNTYISFLGKVFFVLMVLARLFSSVCTTAWDLVMDWGLLDRHSKENLLLREELVYRFRAYYYGAMIEDIIIRFAWILPLALRNFPQLLDTEVVTSVVMFAEVTRLVCSLLSNTELKTFWMCPNKH